MKIGYCRVSTSDQDLALQIERLEAECDTVRAETASGTRMEGRSELIAILDFIRPGDVLIVTKLDRLARSVFDLQMIVTRLRAKDAGLRVLDQPIDTTTPAGKMMFDILGAFAEFETALRRERQMEGINKAKANGAYKGGKKRHSDQDIIDLADQGIGATEIARRLGCSRATIYRAIQKEDA